MKVKVIEMFWDKYNPKILHKVNDVLENVSEERYSEIKDLVQVIENKKEEKKLEERVK